jgi:hypothetical protein
MRLIDKLDKMLCSNDVALVDYAEIHRLRHAIKKAETATEGRRKAYESLKRVVDSARLEANVKYADAT